MKLDQSNRTLYVTAFARIIISELDKMEKENALTVIDLKSKEAIGYIKTGLGPCSVNIYDPLNYKNVITKSEAISTEN